MGETVYNTKEHEGKFTQSYPTTSPPLTSVFYLPQKPWVLCHAFLFSSWISNCQAFKKMHFSPLSLSVI